MAYLQQLWFQDPLLRFQPGGDDLQPKRGWGMGSGGWGMSTDGGEEVGLFSTDSNSQLSGGSEKYISVFPYSDTDSCHHIPYLYPIRYAYRIGYVYL